jgi:hypothetical protein
MITSYKSVFGKKTSFRVSSRNFFREANFLNYDRIMKKYSLKYLLSRSFAKEVYKHKEKDIRNLIFANDEHAEVKKILTSYFALTLDLGYNIASQIVSQLKTPAEIETIRKNLKYFIIY